MRRFDDLVKTPYISRAPTDHTPAFREARKETPDRTINAALPFLIALGTGFVSFIAVGLIAWGLRWPARIVLVIAGTLTLGTLFFWMWRLVADDLLFSIEKIIGVDANRDGVVGKPPVIVLEMVDARNQQPRAYHHLPVSEAQLQALVDGLMSGRPLSEGEWIGRGRPFSKAEFVNLRQYLVTSGLACWRDQRYPTQGVELTAYGKNVVRQLAAPEYVRTREQERGAYARPRLESGGVGGDDEDAA